MAWITMHIKWIMLVAGVLTCTMIYAAIAPASAFASLFGERLDGLAATIVVRNWAVLITLVGGMLIYGAFRPALRPLILVVAALSKLVFVGLVASQGMRYLTGQSGISVVVDSLFVVLFSIYLIAPAPRNPPDIAA